MCGGDRDGALAPEGPGGRCKVADRGPDAVPGELADIVAKPLGPLTLGRPGQGGLKVSLAAATSKLAQADATAARRAEHVHLGIPAYRDIAATTLTAEGPREH